jgi:hypothetical protein
MADERDSQEATRSDSSEEREESGQSDAEGESEDSGPGGESKQDLAEERTDWAKEPTLLARLLAAILDRLLAGGFLIVGAHEKLPVGEWPLQRLVSAETVFRRT